MTTATKAPTFKTKLIEGSDKIGVAIEAIRKTGKKLDDMIQVCGMSVLAHCDKHNNVDVLENLWGAMPQGSRKKALMDWVLKYGKVIANMDKDGKVIADKPFLFNRKGTTDLLGAENEPWFACAPEKLDAPLDFMKSMEAFFSRAGKASDKGKLENGDGLATMRAAFESIKAKASTAVEA